jgi:hypothetical protein
MVEFKGVTHKRKKMRRRGDLTKAGRERLMRNGKSERVRQRGYGAVGQSKGKRKRGERNI